ncbi:MAG TPA: sulfurtransferase [Rhodobacteraceae bacterium]|nr:rhodanese-like domain-containing protein [Amylibacter sp.]HAD28745.1 sulfurtransferase [Paracoccaceae bacterium]
MENPIYEVGPKETWDGLRNDKDAVLVDVRTHAEWSFVGLPDLSELGKELILNQWAILPGMQQNPSFMDELDKQLDGAAPSKIYFLCRSGVRSLSAAHLVSEALAARGQSVDCVNIIGGFEGDLDQDRQRGNMNGWKNDGLPWRQS